jgi:hypothetical protein
MAAADDLQDIAKYLFEKAPENAAPNSLNPRRAIQPTDPKTSNPAPLNTPQGIERHPAWTDMGR